jgi:alkylhydroperoxidase family enzyme
LRDLPTYRASGVLTALEKAVIEYAEQMTQTSVDVPDELFATLKKEFNDKQLVELTAAIAWENYLARLNHALEIPAHGFSEGAFCPIPEAAARSAGSTDPLR